VTGAASLSYVVALPAVCKTFWLLWKPYPAGGRYCWKWRVKV